MRAPGGFAFDFAGRARSGNPSAALRGPALSRLACAARARLIGSCAPGGRGQASRSPEGERATCSASQGTSIAHDGDALFRRHHDRLVRSLQGRLGVSRELAEDAVAFAWMQLVRKPPDYGDPIAWVYVVAKHEAFALIRAARRSELIQRIDSDATAPPPARVVEGRRALALLDRLKPQQRIVLRLRIAGFSYHEISQRTGHTRTWVNRHITEGRRALRQLIEDAELGGDPGAGHAGPRRHPTRQTAMPSQSALSSGELTVIAERVAELVADRIEQAFATRLWIGLVDTAELARRLRVRETWVYAHAGELGAIRLGHGPKARLRFDLQRVARSLGMTPAENAAPLPRARRQGLPAGVPLIQGRGSRR